MAADHRISVRLTSDLVDQIDEVVTWMRRDPGTSPLGIKQSHAIRYLLARGLAAVTEERSGVAARKKAAVQAEIERQETEERERQRAEVEKARQKTELARFDHLRRTRADHQAAGQQISGGHDSIQVMGTGRPRGRPRRSEGGPDAAGLPPLEGEVLGCLVTRGRQTAAMLMSELDAGARRLSHQRVYEALNRLRSAGLVTRNLGRRSGPPYWWSAADSAIP
jgi:hypothetical protein